MGRFWSNQEIAQADDFLDIYRYKKGSRVTHEIHFQCFKGFSLQLAGQLLPGHMLGLFSDVNIDHIHVILPGNAAGRNASNHDGIASLYRDLFL